MLKVKREVVRVRPIADTMEGLTAAPPFGILEPTIFYADGSPREDGASHRDKCMPRNFFTHAHAPGSRVCFR